MDLIGIHVKGWRLVAAAGEKRGTGENEAASGAGGGDAGTCVCGGGGSVGSVQPLGKQEGNWD